MDPYEATNVLFSKIKNIDPEHASKIMGYFLIQDLAERDLIRLAFGPEIILRTMILKAKSQLGLPSNTFSTPTAPSPLNPISRPNSHSPFSQSSPRVASTGGLPSSPSPNYWPLGSPNNGNSGNTFSPKSSPFLSYDNIRAAMQHRNGVGKGEDGGNSSDFIDELQLNEYVSFLDESSSSMKDEFVDPRGQLGGYAMNNGDTHLHRRSFSASDAYIGLEEAGFDVGYKPCMYFARGFCKNDDNCKFMHSGFGDMLNGIGGGVFGSPSKLENLYLQQKHEEMMKLKAAQQHRLAAQFAAGGMSPLAFSKDLNFLSQQQDVSPRLGAAALMMDEEFHKFGRCRSERNDFLAMGLAEKANAASRQIYLTFPADSAFRDEDVSNYFSNFGPVQDVRIPYQQKRMFGFVTFVHPETVKLILARGNPHFICDSRVLVKPYKEKGKVLDKRQQHLQQHLERGSISPRSNLSGVDSAELYDLHLGARMYYNAQEMVMRRKLEEQAELQRAIELQGRRLINLQLPDLNGDLIRNHQRSLSVGAMVSLPNHTEINKTVNLPFDGIDNEVPEAGAVEKEVDINGNNGGGDGKEENSNREGCDQRECSEHVLPDTLFMSPTKSAGNQQSDFTAALMHANESTKYSVTSTSTSTENNLSLATTSTVDVASH
ncbi:zinc finger CCCH domain-containing protein 55-like [Tripterygium wilfordii]|uniref:Zinc finger CCCH domain-containing protein 55-like n=1 Tax=Tripterygium wilfordii TaxID=458696 RepID=A0A7J7BU21_TRIWF|nr:zinc finger CCCH domain-containing protein 55-like isoform X2 [Tripterygium wilfordii]KAF5725460.1 zinc finger CCCH domain-containing protein 55-like [Tripterygium wilfordii]